MKEEAIINAYFLESLSPRAYQDIVYNIKHKIKPSKFAIQDILMSFDVDMLGDTINNLRYEKVVKMVKERLKFERKIEKTRNLARQVRI